MIRRTPSILRKIVLVGLTLATVGAGVAWAVRPDFLHIFGVKEQTSLGQNHFALSLFSRGLGVSYGRADPPIDRRAYRGGSFGGFGYWRSMGKAASRSVCIPYWALLLLFSA